MAEARPFRPVDPDALGIPSPHVEIDTTVAHPARVYDYVLGGKDNYPADREVAEKAIGLIPGVEDEVRGNRQWLRRAVTFAAEQGVDQFLDVGTGIPTVGPTHETAHRVSPHARVVYVDNDPIVLVHARALLVDDNLTTVLQADVRDPDTVLAAARAHLDFTRPICLMFVGLLYFITDDELDGLLETYRDAMPDGSYLLITHGLDNPEVKATGKVYEQQATAPLIGRSREQIADMFTGWNLIEPGLVPLHQWRPTGDEVRCAHLLGGVGVKPGDT